MTNKLNMEAIKKYENGISKLCSNGLGKGMNQLILPPAVCK